MRHVDPNVEDWVRDGVGFDFEEACRSCGHAALVHRFRGGHKCLATFAPCRCERYESSLIPTLYHSTIQEALSGLQRIEEELR